MQTFLNTTFDAEFASPAWNTNWSSATDQVMQSRISTTEIVDTSVSANQTGFRKLAEAYTMMADLGNANLSQSTFQVVVDKAIGLVGSAITDLAALGGSVGTVQQRITTATDKLKIQKDILNNQIVGDGAGRSDGSIGARQRAADPDRDGARAHLAAPEDQPHQLSLSPSRGRVRF